MNLPQHVALIMDGNRRWAKKHNLPSFEGHKYGEKQVEAIVDCAIELGIPYLTFWAFSTENWQRPKREVGFLINLLENLLEKRIDSYHQKNVRFNVIGDLSKFSPKIVEKIKKWVRKTKNNKKITVNLALSYGGRDEIIRAIKKWFRRNRGLEEEKINLTKEEFEKHLDTAGQPDPDLLIRTGGEKRLSGFLLWQIEYSELYFTDVLWPDFTPEQFIEAIKDYSQRVRRFGK